MVLTCLGSSSKGNCYLLQSDKETLVIEAGIPMAAVKQALHFNLSSVIGCIVTHRHNDHAKYIKDFTSCGIRVMALSDVAEAKAMASNPFFKEMKPKHGYKIGGFKVFAIPVAHDVPCLGFVIEHPDMGKLLFITDTMMLEYVIPGLNHIMIEANYSDEILDANIDSGRVPPSMKDRLLHSHMELQTTKEVLKRNNLENVNEIILLHLSDGNSNSSVFREEVMQASGKPTYIADTGFTSDLSIYPY